MDSCCLLFGSIALWEKVIYDFPFDSRPATKLKEKNWVNRIRHILCLMQSNEDDSSTA